MNNKYDIKKNIIFMDNSRKGIERMHSYYMIQKNYYTPCILFLVTNNSCITFLSNKVNIH